MPEDETAESAILLERVVLAIIAQYEQDTGVGEVRGGVSSAQLYWDLQRSGDPVPWAHLDAAIAKLVAAGHLVCLGRGAFAHYRRPAAGPAPFRAPGVH